MNSMKRRFGMLVIAATLFTVSCTDNKTTSKEEVEIKTMDSVSTKLKENSKELEEQTEKVEASLEKLDKEFDSTK